MKFYVICGEMRYVIAGPHITDAFTAAKEVILQYFNEGVEASNVVTVNQQGFDLANHSKEEFFSLEDVMNAAGFEFEEGEEYENL